MLLSFEILAERVVFMFRDDLAEGGEEHGVLARFVRSDGFLVDQQHAFEEAVLAQILGGRDRPSPCVCVIGNRNQQLARA
jgi:hypothetical protein